LNAGSNSNRWVNKRHLVFPKSEISGFGFKPNLKTSLLKETPISMHYGDQV